MQNGGQELLQNNYADFALPEDQWDPEFDVTLRIDLSEMPQTKKVKKSMSEVEADVVRAENDKVRIERRNMVEPIADRISIFKMEFMSAPIRRAMLASLDNKTLDAVEVAYREDEKYWVLTPSAGEV
jgi:hypothetical protein